jgi:hypothetical protein
MSRVTSLVVHYQVVYGGRSATHVEYDETVALGNRCR